MLQSTYKKVNYVNYFLKDLYQFIKNVWKFRKALWNHHWWDYSGTLQFIEIAVNDMANGAEKRGVEIERSRVKKVAKMRRVVEILQNIRESRYFDIVEEEMGINTDFNKFNFEFVPCEDKPGFFEMVDTQSEEDQALRRKYYDRVDELEQQEWNELWDILKGQHSNVYSTQKDWEERFDGSGLQGWWD